jgi:hypothetical protein
MNTTFLPRSDFVFISEAFLRYLNYNTYYWLTGLEGRFFVEESRLCKADQLDLEKIQEGFLALAEADLLLHAEKIRSFV